MTIALCYCSIDLADHRYPRVDHQFAPSGTRHRCEQLLSNGYLCALYRYHLDDGIPHGSITGTRP